MSGALEPLIALEKATDAARRRAEADLAAANRRVRLADAVLAELDQRWAAQTAVAAPGDAAALAHWVAVQHCARADAEVTLRAAQAARARAEERARPAIARADAAKSLVEKARKEKRKLKDRRAETPPASRSIGQSAL